MPEKDFYDASNLDQSIKEQKAADSLYRRLFESSKDGILIIDANTGIIVDVNPFLEKTLGYPRHELVNKAIWELGFLKDVFTDPNKLAELQQKEYERFEDCHLTTADGRKIDFELIGSACDTEHQKLINLNFRIIKERKEAEQKLRESEERFRLIFDLSPIGAAITSPDFSFLRVNSKICQMLGYTHLELSRLTFRDITHPDDLPKDLEAINALNDGKVQQYITDKRYIRKDGTIIWGQLSVSLVRDSHGRKLYYLPMIVDITERKKIEGSLIQASKEWRATFDSISDMVSIQDRDFRILHVNSAYSKALGLPEKDIVGKTCFELVHGTTEPVHACPHQVTIRTSKVARFESYDSGKDNYTEVSTFPIFDEQHEVAGTVHIVHDITARKKIEAEQQDLRDKAEMSTRLAAVGEMAAGIAHEINNPLTGVIGFSELLLERTGLPDDVKEELKIINDGSIRVKEIVSRMLTFARQTKPHKSNVSITELFDNTLELRSYVLKTSNIEVIRNYDPELPWVTADAGQLQQVFLNLIVNAEYAMKKANGKGILTVKTEALDNHVRISISDNGPGMSDETKAKLFQPFFTTKDPGEGTGLGLSLSHGIIEEHGGRIRAESIVGKGTTFIIDLPVTPVVQPLCEPPVERIMESGKRARVLVVDDEPTVRSLITAILTRDGHTVEECDNSEHVLEKLKGTTFDILLVDLRMPGMSGMELYSEISTRWPKLANRIIFITGDTSDLNTKEYLAAHQLPFISKPFDRRTLESTVNRLLLSGD